MELALSKIGNSLGELSSLEVAENVDWLFLAVLEGVTKERDVLRLQLAEQENELPDALKKRKLLKTDHAA